MGRYKVRRDVFVHESGGKVGKNIPSQLTTNSHGIFLSISILKDLIPQNCEEGGVNQWLGCCWFHVGQIGFLVSPKESLDDREGHTSWGYEYA